MKRLIAVTSSLTLAKVPRRIACLVMIPKNTSTRFSQEPEVEVVARLRHPEAPFLTSAPASVSAVAVRHAACRASPESRNR
jgi:hypothetical protein